MEILTFKGGHVKIEKKNHFYRLKYRNYLVSLRGFCSLHLVFRKL